MGTKNKPGLFDAYAKAEPDEPLFTLLARDKYAATLVWLWCTLHELDGETPEKLNEARQCVSDMLDYVVARQLTAAGLGQAGLAAMFELIRAANFKIDALAMPNAATGADAMRVYLAKTEFDWAGQPKKEEKPESDYALMRALVRDPNWNVADQKEAYLLLFRLLAEHDAES